MQRFWKMLRNWLKINNTIIITSVITGKKQYFSLEVLHIIHHINYDLLTYLFTSQSNNLPTQRRKDVTATYNKRTWGVSLTILNIRLIRLFPSYAGFKAHISYSRQPSAYIQHNTNLYTDVHQLWSLAQPLAYGFNVSSTIASTWTFKFISKTMSLVPVHLINSLLPRDAL